MLNKPTAPPSSTRDDATREALVELLDSIGWKASADAQHSRITAALPRLRALLAPSPLPHGGNAYPVDMQQAHAIAHAATHDLPKGEPETELAYLMASAAAMTGKTLLDEFAGLAMLGELSAQSAETGEYTKSTFPALAALSYDLAEAMVAERERRL